MILYEHSNDNHPSKKSDTPADTHIISVPPATISRLGGVRTRPASSPNGPAARSGTQPFSHTVLGTDQPELAAPEGEEGPAAGADEEADVQAEADVDTEADGDDEAEDDADEEADGEEDTGGEGDTGGEE